MLGSQVLCEKPLADIQTRETEPPQISRLVVDNWVDLERQPRGRDPSQLLALLWVRVNASPAAQGGGARSPPSCRTRIWGKVAPRAMALPFTAQTGAGVQVSDSP